MGGIDEVVSIVHCLRMCLVDWPAVDDDLGSATASSHVSRGCRCRDTVKKGKVETSGISIIMYIRFYTIYALLFSDRNIKIIRKNRTNTFANTSSGSIFGIARAVFNETWHEKERPLVSCK